MTFLLKRNAFEQLLLVLFLNVVLVSTLGRIAGFLIPIAAFGGGLLILVTIRAFWSFGQEIANDLGSRIRNGWLFIIFAQLLWAIFRAPLDVDGIFYHLTIILEALQQNQWGHWDFKIWQVQNTPKFGEIPNLTLIALGGPFGYRFAQLGHFSSMILGAWACFHLAKSFGLKKPVVYGLAFSVTPIVIKQMSSNYVDMAMASYWLAVASCCVSIAKNYKAKGKSPWIFLFLSTFLFVGIKMNAVVFLVALLPLLWVAHSSTKTITSILCRAFPLMFLAVFLSSLTWMVPNWIQHGNPIFPLQPSALIPGSPLKLLPDEIPVTVLHGPAAELDVPKPLQWLLLFFLFEPVAQYDNNGGAWGFLGIWAFFVLGYAFFQMLRKRPIRFPKNARPALFFLLALFLTFLLNPGRVTPRYGMLMGFVFIFPALFLWAEKKLPQAFSTLLLLVIFFQSPYILGERVLLRGIRGLPLKEKFEVIRENVVDVFQHGEPQHPDRWMHRPYVPTLRKNEPREVTVGKDCIDLTALYWGRTFSNRVQVLPECSRWPFTTP